MALARRKVYRIIYSNNLAKHLDDKKIDMDEKTAKVCMSPSAALCKTKLF